jgi:hypothetical protein
LAAANAAAGGALVTFRTFDASPSAISSDPPGSTASPVGAIRAAEAGPPSPPSVVVLPSPAMRRMRPPATFVTHPWLPT